VKCLVTGGAGFIGSHLARRLAAAGHEVRIIDDLSTGRRENLTGAAVDLAVLDLSRDDLAEVVRGMDSVFHLAAVPSVPRSVRDPLGSHAAAATATLRLLVAARDAGVRRFVNASSSSVYGDVGTPPMHEDMPTRPKSPYGVAKLAGEGYTRVFAALYGMATVSLRYFNVFGPHQDPSSEYAAVVPRFIRAYMRREPPMIYGDGRQSRDFTFVDNVVDANLLALDAPALSGESVNVAAGDPHTVLELLDAIGAAFPYRLEPVFGPARPGDIRDSHADITLARQVLRYRPATTFADGLRRTVEWMREGSARQT
jgi:nucleoside-diphosphate-sugar epimerase